MADFFVSLVTDGFFPVFRTLVSFLPTVVMLLVVVSLFENSGFIAGFGCTTLAVGTIDEKNNPRRARKFAQFMTFIPCSAKLPVLVFICSAIIGATVFGVVFLYLLSIFIGIVLGGYSVLAPPRFREVSVLEFLKSITINTLQFLRRISFGVILAVTVLYTLQYFSILLPIARVFEPVFVPIGLGSAAVIACLAFGLVAKEMIIGAVLAFGVSVLDLTFASSLSFVVFVLLYTPCVPALTAIRAKFGLGFAFRAAVFNFVVAYLCAFVIYNFTILVF